MVTYDHSKCLSWDTLYDDMYRVLIWSLMRSPEVKRSSIFDLSQNLDPQTNNEYPKDLTKVLSCMTRGNSRASASSMLIFKSETSVSDMDNSIKDSERQRRDKKTPIEVHDGKNLSIS